MSSGKHKKDKKTEVKDDKKKAEQKKKDDKKEKKPLAKGPTQSYETRGGEVSTSTSGMWNNTNKSDEEE